MKIAITFTDQNPDGGAVIGKETYIVPVDEKYVPLKVLRQKNRLVSSLPSFAKHRRLSITKNGKKKRI